MALALTSRLQFRGRSAGGGVGSGVTSGSFTPSNNSLLVAVIGGEKGSGTLLLGANSSLSGGSLTWTQRAAYASTASGYTHIVEIWTAPVTTGASMSLTWSNSAGNGSDDVVSMQVVDVTGYDTGSPVGAVAAEQAPDDGAFSATLSATPAASSIVIGALLLESGGGGDLTMVGGSGWTDIYQPGGGGGGEAGYACVHTQYRTGLTTTAVPWADVNAGPDGTFSGLADAAAIEIKEAGGGGGSIASGTATMSATGSMAAVGRSTAAAPATMSAVGRSIAPGSATVAGVLTASGTSTANFVGADATNTIVEGILSAAAIGALVAAGVARRIVPRAVAPLVFDPIKRAALVFEPVKAASLVFEPTRRRTQIIME